MNPLNYASLEASQRLVDAGIVLETEVVWAYGVLYYKDRLGELEESVPAPSMAEVLRELSSITIILNEDGVSIENGRREFKNTNPSDALIDLLIWVTEQKRKEK